MTIGICGIGVVGSAIAKSLKMKKCKTVLYDKYKKEYNNFNELLECDIIFLCLPTQYDSNSKRYCLKAVEEVLDQLHNNNYNKLVVLKSTVLPTTTFYLSDKYKLNMAHNPEFLTARTAFEDFHNQQHIVLGKEEKCNKTEFDKLINFYKYYYPDSDLSICLSTESESMKIFLNSFYAIKVQYFTELYLLCNRLNIQYDNVKNLMLKNNWINPMHTNIPGPDGNVSYGGLCFPKDTKALNYFMEQFDSPSMVLDACIHERDTMRKDDQQNIIL